MMGGMFRGMFGGQEIKRRPKNDAKNFRYETALAYEQGFQNKNVIITGATGGIGSHILRRLVKSSISFSSSSF